MKRGLALARALAVLGTVLVWIPVVAPFVFTRWSQLGSEQFNFDWLMPAELGPAVFLGGALLLAGALLTHHRRALVGWGLGVALASVVIGAVLTTATGLASGATDPEGILWLALIGPIAVFAGSAVFLGVAGILLTKDLFGRGDTAGMPAVPAT